MRRSNGSLRSTLFREKISPLRASHGCEVLTESLEATVTRSRREGPPHRRWTRLAAGAVLITALIACNGGEEVLDTLGENEVFQFDYAYATYNPQANVYVAQRGSGSDCTAPIAANLTLAQLADLIQARNTSYGIHACATKFLIAGTDAQAVRDDGGILFGAEATGGQNLTIYGNGFGSTSTQIPSGLVIVTSGGLTVGQKTTLGGADISFGASGDAWSCEDGGPVWSGNASGAGGTFFEITLNERDDTAGRVAGDFQCIARNVSDTTNTALLLILDGGFALRIN